MTRALLAALSLALTVPASALACSEHVAAKLDAIAKGQTPEQAEQTAKRVVAARRAKARAQKRAAAQEAAKPQAVATTQGTQDTAK